MIKYLQMFNINKSLYFLLGIIILVNLIYYRLIVIRLPKDITNVYIDICVFIIVCYCAQLISLIYKGVKAKYFPKKSSNKLFQQLKIKILNPLDNYYNISLKTVDNYIKHTLLGPNLLGKNLKIFCEFMIKYFGIKHNTYKGLFILFDVIPKIIILIILGVDILLLKQFYYIYQFAWLILVSLSFNYSIFTLKEFSEWNINILNTEFIIVKSVKFGYTLTTTDLIQECLYIYREDISDAQPKSIINRMEAIPINQGHIYIFREEPASIYDTEDAIEAYFDSTLKNFDFIRIIRELVYVIERCPLYWKMLYFNCLRYSIYITLWFYVFVNLPNNFYINGEWLFIIQNIEEPFSLQSLPPHWL